MRAYPNVDEIIRDDLQAIYREQQIYLEQRRDAEMRQSPKLAQGGSTFSMH